MKRRRLSLLALLALAVGVGGASVRPAAATTSTVWSPSWLAEEWKLSDGSPIPGWTRAKVLDTMLRYGPTPRVDTPNPGWESRWSGATASLTTDQRAQLRTLLDGERDVVDAASKGNAVAQEVETGLWRARVSGGLVPGVAAFGDVLVAAAALDAGYKVGTLLNDYVLHIHTTPGAPFTAGSFVGFKWTQLCNSASTVLGGDCGATSARVAPNVGKDGRDHGWMVVSPKYHPTSGPDFYTTELMNAANYGAALGDAIANYATLGAHADIFGSAQILKPYNYPSEDGAMRVEDSEEWMLEHLRVTKFQQYAANDDIANGTITSTAVAPDWETASVREAATLATVWPGAGNYVAPKLDPTQSDPTDGGGTGGGTGSCPCTIPPVAAPAITPEVCDKFPFGVFCWFATQADAMLGGAAIAPSVTWPEVNLGTYFGTDIVLPTFTLDAAALPSPFATFITVLRDALAFLVWVLGLWYVGQRMLGTRGSLDAAGEAT